MEKMQQQMWFCFHTTLWIYNTINFEQFWRKKNNNKRNTDFISHLTTNLLEVSVSIHARNDTFTWQHQKSSHQLTSQHQSWSQLVGIHDSILVYCYQLELHCSVSLTVATMTNCHIKTLALGTEQSPLSWQPASLACRLHHDTRQIQTYHPDTFIDMNSEQLDS